jgi:ubiquinone/menaquinone biosynthesis C-methylase UbiE
LENNRHKSFSEGIEDPEVGIAFNKIQKLPPFKIIRGIVVKHVFKLLREKYLNQDVALLDIGCGTGHLLKELHHKKAKLSKILRVRLFGIDISEEMVEECQTTMDVAHIHDIEIKKGSASLIPYPNESFSVVVSSLSLHHWSEVNKSFSEIYRILKKDGFFVLFDFRRDASQNWVKFLGFITHHIVPKALRNVEEPLGSLKASYLFEEILKLVEQTPWDLSRIFYEKKGPFMMIQMNK